MKISKADKEALIAGILPQLAKETQESWAYSMRPGSELLNEGQTHADKHPIIPAGKYKCARKIIVPMNHKRRLAKIIDGAPDAEAMKDRLADYLVAHGTHFKKQ